MMLKKYKKHIIYTLLAVIIASGSIGYYMFNKGPVNVKNASAIKIDASALYQTFFKDSVEARLKYADKILEVSGTVVSVSKNQQNQAIVMLQTNESGAYVNCTMEGESENLAIKMQVTLKGICTGMGMSEPDLGILGDVYLTRTYMMN